MSCRLLCVAACASLLVACGGGGGTVVLDLTDAPPDTGNMAHVYVTISSVDVHVVDRDSDENGDPNDTSIDNDDAWQLATPRAGTFDLLALRNSRLELARFELADGKITQIRLHIDTEPQATNEVVLTDDSGLRCPLDLHAIDPMGVKIDHPFDALDPAGGTLRVLLDFNVDQSLDKEGDCVPGGFGAYVLRPAIAIKSVERKP